MFKISNLLPAMVFLSTAFFGCSKDVEILDSKEVLTKEIVVQDMTISSNATSSSDSKVHQVIAWTDGGNVFYRRALFQFDLGFITEPSQIISATLSLYGTTDVWNDGHSNISGSNEGVIERITSEWDESTVTWTNKPTTSTANGVNLNASDVAGEDYLDTDITALVKNIASGENQGLMIRLKTEEYYRALMFHSMEADDMTKRPVLTIKYKL